MIPVHFPQVNTICRPPPGVSDKDCTDLPVHFTGEVMISCWVLSVEEWEEVKSTGRVWLHVFAPRTPPVKISGFEPYSTDVVEGS